MERLPLLATVTEATRRYGEQFFPLLRVIALPALAHSVLSYLPLEIALLSICFRRLGQAAA
jgi:hypothetical protein